MFSQGHHDRVKPELKFSFSRSMYIYVCVDACFVQYEKKIFLKIRNRKKVEKNVVLGMVIMAMTTALPISLCLSSAHEHVYVQQELNTTTTTVMTTTVVRIGKNESVSNGQTVGVFYVEICRLIKRIDSRQITRRQTTCWRFRMLGLPP